MQALQAARNSVSQDMRKTTDYVENTRIAAPKVCRGEAILQEQALGDDNCQADAPGRPADGRTSMWKSGTYTAAVGSWLEGEDYGRSIGFVCIDNRCSSIFSLSSSKEFRLITSLSMSLALSSLFKNSSEMAVPSFGDAQSVLFPTIGVFTRGKADKRGIMLHI